MVIQQLHDAEVQGKLYSYYLSTHTTNGCSSTKKVTSHDSN